MIVLWVLCYILLAVASVIFLIIFIPYEYYAYGKKLDECYIKGYISWLFGGVKIKFNRSFPGNSEVSVWVLGLNKRLGASERSKNIKEEKPQKKKDKSKKDSGFKEYLSGDVIKRILAALFKILKHCMPRKFYMIGKVGFEDPANTGMLYGVIGMAYNLFDRFNIRIQPVFDEEVIEGRFLIRGRLWLPYIILVAIGLLITKPFRNILLSKFARKFKGGVQYVK